tara:strand:+ start:4113 stop:5450 length:1338 start_codon:yes stop_codon:yes gene_type:complete
MCGLTGVAGDITAKTKDVFRTLLVLDTLRGPHSTGVASIGPQGDWNLVKKKGNPYDLFDSREYNSVMTYPSYALIGHNRYATKGKINNINAHPFEFEHVVGAHNGTIRGQHRLPEHTQFEVDSENIFYSIDKYGIDETLAVLEGAYALTYWDKRTEDLILLRNSERPLYYTMTEDNRTMFWASEEWMLRIATSRCGVKHGNVIEVRPCNIYRFDIERKFNSRPIKVSIQAFTEFKAPLPVAQHNKGSSAWPHNKKSEPAKKPLVGQHEEGKDSPLSAAMMTKLIKTVVEFEVDGHKQNAHRQWFITGHMKEFPEVEVRVFASPDTKLWNTLVLNYDSVFEGEVSSYSKVGDTACVNLKLSTVEEVIEFEDDGDDDEVNEFSTFLGYNNKLLTEDQFNELTANGCAWCSGNVTTFDAKNIHWVAHDSFVCADCQEVAEVKDYIKAV